MRRASSYVRSERSAVPDDDTARSARTESRNLLAERDDRWLWPRNREADCSREQRYRYGGPGWHRRSVLAPNRSETNAQPKLPFAHLRQSRDAEDLSRRGRVHSGGGLSQIHVIERIE